MAFCKQSKKNSAAVKGLYRQEIYNGEREGCQDKKIQPLTVYIKELCHYCSHVRGYKIYRGAAEAHGDLIAVGVYRGIKIYPCTENSDVKTLKAHAAHLCTSYVTELVKDGNAQGNYGIMTFCK